MTRRPGVCAAEPVAEDTERGPLEMTGDQFGAPDPIPSTGPRTASPQRPGLAACAAEPVAEDTERGPVEATGDQFGAPDPVPSTGPRTASPQGPGLAACAAEPVAEDTERGPVEPTGDQFGAPDPIPSTGPRTASPQGPGRAACAAESVAEDTERGPVEATGDQFGAPDPVPSTGPRTASPQGPGQGVCAAEPVAEDTERGPVEATGDQFGAPDPIPSTGPRTASPQGPGLARSVLERSLFSSQSNEPGTKAPSHEPVASTGRAFDPLTHRVQPRRLLAAVLGTATLAFAAFAASRAVRGSDAVLHTVERGLLRNEILASGIVDAVKKTPISVPQDLSDAMRVSWLRAAGPVAAGDVVLSFDPADLEKDALDSRADSASASSKLDKAKSEGSSKVQGLDLDFSVTTDELTRARDIAPEDTRIFSRNQIIDAALDRGVLEHRLTATTEKKDATHKLTGVDMELAAIEGRKAELKLRRAEKGLSAMRVVAPHDGILVFPMNWRGEVLNIGDTAWPGQTIAEIPDLSQLQARVFVLEGDAFGLAALCRARIEIDGQPGLAYEAKVKRVDTLAKPRERGSPVKYFETWLDLPPEAFKNVKPGQRVRATILLAELADALWIPRGALYQKEGRRYVLKSEGSELREADVTVGAASLGRVQVLTGLDPGDRVALSDPRRSGSATGGSDNGAAAPAATSGGR